MAGRSIGNYVLKRLIGKGGMGEVYLAEHPRMGKQVAIKILKRQHSTNQAIAKRFLNEARAATRIKSDHVVTIMDLGEEEDGTCYIIMELLEGYSLRDALRRGPLDIVRAVHIGIGIARALAAAHAVGIVHRDLKPDNLFLVEHNGDPDFVKVLDFGIAKMLDPAASHHTQPGAILGTPAYMAPEQCLGAQAEIDARTDLYSFGVILYQMVTGRRPFELGDFLEMVSSHLNVEPRPPSLLNPDVSHALESVILRALRKSRVERFQSAVEMAYALGASIGLPRSRIGPLSVPPATLTRSKQSSTAEPPPADTMPIPTESESVTHEEPSVAEGSRRSATLAAAAVALLFLAVGIGMGVRRAQRSRNESPQPAVTSTAAVDATVAASNVAQQDEDAAEAPPPAAIPLAAVESGRKKPQSAPRTHAASNVEKKTDMGIDQPRSSPVENPAPADPPSPTKAIQGKLLELYQEDAKAETAPAMMIDILKSGRRKLNDGDVNAAMVDFKKARDLDARNAEAIAGLGECAFEMGDYSNALDQLEAAVRLAPKNHRYQILLGQTYFKLDDFNAALHWCAASLKISPGDHAAKTCIAAAQRKLDLDQ